MSCLHSAHQKAMFGCGCAKVKTIAGTGTAEIRTLANSLGIFSDDTKLFLDTAYVRRLLSHYGYATADNETPFQSWALLPDTALLATQHPVKQGRSFLHWMIFCRNRKKPEFTGSAAMLKHNLHTDFDEIKPKWYITLL